MVLIVTPFGKKVAIDDEKRVKQWLSQPGYRKATVEEERDYVEYANRKAEMMNQADQKEKGVHFFTVSQGGKDGYAIASKNLHRELTKQGLNISFQNSGQKVALVFHSPYSITGTNAPYRVLYTMFESTKIPDDWIEYVKAADEVIVPSRWCQKVFEKAGVKVRVVPLGYDDSVFQYIERTPKDPAKDTFYFLHYNAFNIRKGFTEVFKAFIKEFDHTEPVKMIFKTTLDRIPDIIPITKGKYPNIEIITGKTSDHELAKLCGRADAFVFPSRGEGFGITPVEAMATGMPVIVPNAHGISEYFDEEYMYEVKIKEECPALYNRFRGEDVGKMVICDTDHLAAQMRYVYEHQKEAIAKGRKAAKYVKERYTFTHTASQIRSILEKALDTPLKEVQDFEILPVKQIT